MFTPSGGYFNTGVDIRGSTLLSFADELIFIHFLGCGRVPGSATYTKLRVGQSDSIKLSLLHGSGNHKLLQGEGIKIIIYLCCMEVGTKVVE